MTARTGHIPTVLAIAGSDSGGGAGIQADLKAFARAGVHGTTAVTAITAQNTVGVSAIHTVPGDVVIAQVRAVAEDIGVDAVKVGMLGTVGTIEAVAAALELLADGTPVVIDPVMVAESGALLLEPAAREALIASLLPRATVLTPNLDEAVALLADDRQADDRSSPRTDQQIEALARALLSLGPDAVVITGGHRERAVDIFVDATATTELRGERYADGAAHGSGCTHSATLAAELALGRSPLQAARRARKVAARAVRDGLREIGAGPGPVDVHSIARRRTER